MSGLGYRQKQILEIIRDENRWWLTQELATRIKVPPKTVHNAMTSLEGHGIVHKVKKNNRVSWKPTKFMESHILYRKLFDKNTKTPPSLNIKQIINQPSAIHYRALSEVEFKVFNTLCSHTPNSLSRPDLTKKTNLPRTTIYDALNYLISFKLVKNSIPECTTRGRPSTRYQATKTMDEAEDLWTNNGTELKSFM